MGADRLEREPFVKQVRQCVGSRSETLQCQRRSTRACVVAARSPVMLPIPGTSSLAHLEENMAAEKLQLSAEEWKKIEELARS